MTLFWEYLLHMVRKCASFDKGGLCSHLRFVDTTLNVEETPGPVGEYTTSRQLFPSQSPFPFY